MPTFPQFVMTKSKIGKQKKQIMQTNVETQHKHMFSLYVGSLCNDAFPIARFTCIMTSQVFVVM